MILTALKAEMEERDGGLQEINNTQYVGAKHQDI